MVQKPLKRTSRTLLIPALIMAGVFAQSGAAQPAATRADTAPLPVVPPASFLTTSQCWQDWLAKNDVHEGENITPDGRVLFVARASEVVHARADSDQWVVARNAVAGQLHLSALKSISDFIAQKVEGASSAEWLQSGATPPPAVRRAIKGVSLADRARRLSGLKLDNEIRKFDPKWDGTGKSDAARRQAATLVSSRFRQALSTGSELLATGATTVLQCEGPAANDGTATAGQYEVLLGVVWSPRLAYIASGLGRGDITPEKGAERLSLADRFAEFSRTNRDWLSMTLGSRVWSDENGEMVVVGFGAAPATRLKVLDEGRAKLGATAAIARFASESIAARTSENTHLDYKEFSDGTSGSFDSGTYRQNIESAMKTIRLRGVYKIAEWRGKHPVSGAPMNVVAYAWKPSSSAAAKAAGRLLDPATRASAPGLEYQPAHPVIAPVRAGASSPVADY